MRFVLGLDVAKADFKAHLQSVKASTSGTFENSKRGWAELRKWLLKQGVEELHVCMEATGRYGEGLALWLLAQGHKVSVVNPNAIKAHATSQLSRSKTDRVDARLIADFCWKNNPAEWSPPSVVRRELQDVGMYIAGLRKMATAQKQRLKSGISCKAVIKALNTSIDQLERQIEEMYEIASRLIEGDEALKEDRKNLHTMLGVKEKTSTVLLCKIDFHKFSDSRAVASFAGLTTRQHQSGQSVSRRGRISKMGDPEIRRALYLPASNAMRNDPAMRQFAERLASRGKDPELIRVAVMRKMLTIAWAVVTKHQPYDWSRVVQVA